MSPNPPRVFSAIEVVVPRVAVVIAVILIAMYVWPR